MSKLLIEKINASSVVSSVFNKYFIQANKYTSVFNSDAMANSSKNLETIKKHIIKLRKNISILVNEVSLLNKGYKLIFDIFSSAKTIDEALSIVHKLFSVNIKVHENSNISTTASIEALDMLNMILRIYTDYTIKSKELDEEILQQLAIILFSMSKSDDGEPYKVAQTQYRLFDNTVELYAKYVKLLLDFYYGEKDPRRYFLVNQLESDKTWQLTQYDVDSWNNIRFHDVPPAKTLNPFISEWGLIPQTSLISLTEIFQKLFTMDSIPEVMVDDIQKSIDNVSKIKKITIRLIVINKIMPHAIEHDISRIIGQEAQEYRMSDQSGVNIKSLKKFNILKTSTTDDWNFSIMLYEKIVASYKEEVDVNLPPSKLYYIIETINNITFRILAPYKAKDRYSIHGSYIPKLLRCLEKTKESSRITEYNKGLELSMYENMLSMPKFPLQEIGIQSSQIIDIGMVRWRIQECLMNVYDECAKTQKTKTLSSVREIIFSNELVQQFINTQIIIYFMDKSYFKLVEDPTLIRKTFNQNDILVTFLLHVNKAIRGFQREMNDNFHEVIDKIDDSDIKQWSYDKQQIQFRLIFEKIVGITVKHIFTNDTNSYRYVRFKVDILNHI